MNKDRWAAVGISIILLLLTALGAMSIILHNQTTETMRIFNNQNVQMIDNYNTQTWEKLNRVTALFLSERDLINTEIKKICERQSIYAERLSAIESINGRNGKKK